MAGCHEKITYWVARGYTHKEYPGRCGQTGEDGYPLFCEKCESLYKDRDWKREAAENGEQWDEDY